MSLIADAVNGEHELQDAADAILAALEDGYNRLEVDFPFGPSDSAPPHTSSDVCQRAVAAWLTPTCV